MTALTPAEHDLIARLIAVWDGFVAVVGAGPTRDGDLAEVAFHVHALQDKVLSQAAARAYPDRYRLLGETLADPDNDHEETR